MTNRRSINKTANSNLQNHLITYTYLTKPCLSALLGLCFFLLGSHLQASSSYTTPGEAGEQCRQAYIAEEHFYHWSMDPLRCRSMPPNSPGNDSDLYVYSYSTISVSVPPELSIKDPVSEMNWAAPCSSLIAWGANFYIITDCTENHFTADPKCPPNYTRTTNHNLCEAKCTVGHTWDSELKQCIPPIVANSCQTQSTHPIDFIEGKKYRKEALISVGHVFPISLLMYYNNQANSYRTHHGFMAYGSRAQYVADTVAPMSATTFQGQHWRIASGDFLQSYQGNAPRFWRHNYEEALVTRNNTFVWHRANGNDMHFSLEGVSASDPSYRVLALNEGEFGFAGYRLIQGLNPVEKIFDHLGRLRRQINTRNGLYHEVIYQPNALHPVRIQHSLGPFLDLSFDTHDLRSIYLTNPRKEHYLTEAIDHSGRKVTVSWAHEFSAPARNYHLVSQITHPAGGEASHNVSGRSFEYNDERWPASITQIYEVSDVALNDKKLYAEFTYDTEGRATYSGLAHGIDAVSLAYPNPLARTVTNALGKVSTYTFANEAGVKRLKRITGEPTATCVKTETYYTYDTRGNVVATETSGGITRYQYNARNLETSRTDAFGTPEARMIETEWHPTFNIKTKITDAHRETVMTYNEQGQLQSRTIRDKTQGTEEATQ